MNIYNWILAAASPWSDEYHSLFIRPLLILPYIASITADCGAGDGDDDDHDGDDDGDDDHDEAVNRRNLKWSPCLFNAQFREKVG